MRIVLYILLISFYANAQNDIVWDDLTNHLDSKMGGWGIGNSCGEDFRINGFYEGNLDMNNQPLEILNSHFVVNGDILNQGEIIYLCDNAVLEIKGNVLGVENPIKETFKIYPNPAVYEINIKGIEVTSLELYDITGRKLKDYKTFGTLHKIIIDELQAGIYFLKINNSITKKIIKK